MTNLAYSTLQIQINIEHKRKLSALYERKNRVIFGPKPLNTSAAVKVLSSFQEAVFIFRRISKSQNVSSGRIINTKEDMSHLVFKDSKSTNTSKIK